MSSDACTNAFVGLDWAVHNHAVCVIDAAGSVLDRFEVTHDRDGLAELMRRSKKKIDAVFCSSDLLALGVLTEARALGLQVPRQLAVVGFGDLDFAADLEPALTTVHIKGAAIGQQAAQFIVERAEGRPVAERVIDIGFSIIERQST